MLDGRYKIKRGKLASSYGLFASKRSSQEPPFRSLSNSFQPCSVCNWRMHLGDPCPLLLAGLRQLRLLFLMYQSEHGIYSTSPGIVVWVPRLIFFLTVQTTQYTL